MRVLLATQDSYPYYADDAASWCVLAIVLASFGGGEGLRSCLSQPPFRALQAFPERHCFGPTLGKPHTWI